MGIKIGALKALGSGEPLFAWLACPMFPGVDMRMEFVSDAVERKFYGLTGAKNETARNVSDDEFRDFHLGRIVDWRGVDDDEGEAASFDRAQLEAAWAANHKFRVWVLYVCREPAFF